MTTKTTASIGLMLVLTACSAQSPTSSGVPASPIAATTGTLTGLVRMDGRPLNPQTGKQALNGSPGRNWTVKVMSGFRTVAEAKSDAAAHIPCRRPDR